MRANLDLSNFCGYSVERISEEIRLAQRHINFLNWSAAQQAYLFFSANQDPEKPKSNISPADFLPFPSAAQEKSSRTVERLSEKTRRELQKCLDNEWLNRKLGLQLYSIMAS